MHCAALLATAAKFTACSGWLRHGLLVAALLQGATACSRNEPAAKPGARPAVAARSTATQLVLAEQQRAHVAIVAPARLFDQPPTTSSGKQRKPRLTAEEKRQRAEAQRLMASVKDLGAYLAKLSGVEVAIVHQIDELPPGTRPILIGELAANRFGPVGAHTLGQQALRLVVTPTAVGLFGESDLATGYAIYELLDRLGCRWFMPGELGEDIPRRDRLSISVGDDTIVPATLYRGIWYADDDFKRRNRLGGVRLSAGHQLERWITPEQRAEHPEWRAQVRGAAHPTRLRWSEAGVAEAMARNIDAQLNKRPTESISLSPGDGLDFDESSDRSLDGGDWDPTLNSISITDRLLVLANRVATELAPKRPELLLGLLAYASYTRPPLREKVHPNVVPVIAPITYCRNHPWSNDSCPGARELRRIVEGWASKSERIAFRGYLYNLAEPAAPNPMMRKWSSDLPFLFAHKTQFFQPETLPNFETSLPALYLGIRLAFRAQQDPSAILDELFARFYGSAASPARRYWDLIDRAWTDTAEYSGGGLGHTRRFPASVLEQARKLARDTEAACRTDIERQRVAMLTASLGQHELYMKMSADFRQGRLATLASDQQRWLTRAADLSEQYAANSAFGKARWAKTDGVYGHYFKRFLEQTYLEADRIHRDQTLLLPAPACHFRYRLASSLSSPFSSEPPELGLDDKTSDICSETWASLGLYDYFGAMWYQTDFELPPSSAGRRSFLWLSKVDGVAQVWLNDQLVFSKDNPTAPTAEAHLRPLTFEVTSALRPSANRLKVLVRRTALAELGGGGLLGPVYLYRGR
jgi:hypothetical protein